MADKWGRGSSTNRGAVQQSLPIGPPARQPDAWTALPPWTGRVARGLADRLLAERDRWLLWLPVFLGLGIAAFFSLPGEPPALAAVPALVLVAAALAGARRADRAGAALPRALCVALAATAAGFLVAQARVEAVRAPILPREGTYDVTGRVRSVEPRGHGVRIVLASPELSRLSPDETPRYVRVTFARGGVDLDPGAVIRVRARLRPPPGPTFPGGFDGARMAYFQQLGGLGYSVGAPEILSTPDRPDAGVPLLRARIARRIHEIIPGPSGAFAAALMAGVRSDLDEHTWHDFQVAGLAHLIAIAGLHMSLVAGTVFTVARFILALIPWIALRVRVHKPAALIAFAVAAFYLAVSGATVPTQRAFVSFGVALVAILLDRNPFSLRLLAWAALAVLAIQPEALGGASFQLSFAAVLGLMATYEAFRLRALAQGDAGPLGHLRSYVLGVIATTLIASSATAPFSAYHFQTIATYGILGNLIAVPITSFLVMPMGLLGLALMPVGLDAPAFRLMGWGCDAVLWTAHTVASLPGASITVHQWPLSVLLLMMLGGLWLGLWRRRWRLLGLVPCAAALMVAVLGPRPVLVVDPELDAAARRLPDGRVVTLEWHRASRLRTDWLRALGADEAVRGPTSGGEGDGIACDEQGCVVTVDGAKVSLSRRAGAAVEDCALAALVVSRAGPEACPAGGRLVGPRALWASQGLTVWRTGGGLEVETVAASRGRWPWSTPPGHAVARSFNQE